MLEAVGLEVAYGDAPALWSVSLRIGDGELVTVVGPNGAGKTTLINAIARLHPLRAGTMTFDGVDLARAASHAVCRAGIAVVPEGRRLWATMTVEENLDMGCYERDARARRARSLDEVYALFPVLGERRRQRAAALSGGQQQMLAIARALMARPRLLLLDEPSLGLAPAVVSQVFAIITTVHASGLSVLLVEQNAAMALAIAQRAYVLEQGRIVAEGPPETLLSQPDLRKAYLGIDGIGEERDERSGPS
jgi:branched-chain amino acid transport system ATP-binding protein